MEKKNEIVVYQPNETLRLEVKLEDETVWLTQSQMSELFGCTTRNVRLHLENIYACGELEPEATRKDFFLVRLLAKKSKGVTVDLVASPRGNKLSQSDVAKFNAQYGGLIVRTSRNFHDRFLIVDDQKLYLFGASLKDLGQKCFAFTELDAAAIPELKKRV